MAIPPQDTQLEVSNSIRSVNQPRDSETISLSTLHCEIIFSKCHTSLFWVPGIINPAFMPELDAPPPPPPWLTEAENDLSVAPSQRAQSHLPRSPNNLRRLAPLRISNRSTDSFVMADAPSTEESPKEPFEEPPKRDSTHL